MTLHRLSAALLFLTLAARCFGGEPASSFPWVDASGVAGAVAFAGEELQGTARDKLAAWVRSNQGQVVVVPNASGAAEGVLVNPPQMAGTVLAAGSLDERLRDQLIAAAGKHPGHVSFCIGRGVALGVRGRQLEVLGDGVVTVMLAASAGRPLLEIELKGGGRHDLTMLRRAALERSLADFPPQAPPPPIVEHGSLFIHGGGEMPAAAALKFLELAGGPDAPIVVLPIAAEGELPEDSSRDTRVLTRVGATNVISLRARSKSEVESPEFATALKKAKGVWFNGGRQWRFVDAYLGTQAEDLFRDVLRRGGVIGGSSAGASIQSQYMPRGSPLGNMDVMAEGYERGLGFLPGAAVDQHFTQRRRHADMTAIMRRYPQLLGIGLDEGTSIVVQRSVAEIIGRGNVHFYDYRCGPPVGERDYTIASAGQKYDLVERKLIEPSRQPGR
jgi:cyanophycinase